MNGKRVLEKVRVVDMELAPAEDTKPTRDFLKLSYSEHWAELERIRQMWPGIVTVGDPDQRSPKIWGWEDL